jgi:hypothetical protein
MVDILKNSENDLKTNPLLHGCMYSDIQEPVYTVDLRDGDSSETYKVTAVVPLAEFSGH